jgi:alcohol dehydrogenase YqhD (iron-dependent ADH family)
LKGEKASSLSASGSMKRFGFLDKVVNNSKKRHAGSLFEGVEPIPLL